MGMILAAIVVAGGICWGLMWHGRDGYDRMHLFSSVAGVGGAILTGISALFYVFAGWNWIASEYKTQIINREYGTHYTQQEVFYASDVINTIRELNRNRYEINGDLLHGKDVKP